MNLLLFKCRFFGLIKGISPKICIVRVRVKSYKRSFEPFCVWIWLDKCLHILWPETDWSFLYRNCFTELRPVPDSSDKGSKDWRRCWKLSENNCWPSAVWLLTICRLTRSCLKTDQEVFVNVTHYRDSCYHITESALSVLVPMVRVRSLSLFNVCMPLVSFIG